MVSWGSSPLARGLPVPVRGSTVHGRIIPARAGFTFPISPTCATVSGSSPLARGLPQTRESGPSRCGIIPARAGFTIPDARDYSPKRDHPRSRGVYSNPIFNDLDFAGSSPLARGLPASTGVRHARRWIIPARAGFTQCNFLAINLAQDHPRSRGVYRRETRHMNAHRGIIPARAGFTSFDPELTVDHRDHPRSRGVYLSARSASHSYGGSSPLARGLRAQSPFWTVVRRIIPARAGFTTSGRARSRRFRDHPRSRGVYESHTTGPFSDQGSSPLARGLPRTNCPPPVRATDHPRSRGVYAKILGGIIAFVGSSPLARGLHTPSGMRWCAARIIPARAGFTHRLLASRHEQSDHPRSRGVY